jgi:hypothetical protein
MWQYVQEVEAKVASPDGWIFSTLHGGKKLCAQWDESPESGTEKDQRKLGA